MTVVERAQDKKTNGQLSQAALQYQYGLGNEFSTEALPGALPEGQNSPQRLPYGLISELVSGTTFSAQRSLNRRSYQFRIRPSVIQGRFKRYDHPLFLTPPFGLPASPNHYNWGPFKKIKDNTDFIDGIATLCGNGSPHNQEGMAVHVYAASASMKDRAFSNADGEMLIVPHTGDLRITTEYGIIDARLGDIVVIPRGIKIRVDLLSPTATGFVGENFGLPLRLPELGIIGSNGLANVSDFAIPVAAYEEKNTKTEYVHKFAGNLWATTTPHSPFDVVAWRGTLYPFKYDLRRYVALGTLTVDHPDPSIFSVLTSPSDSILGPNFDVMALTPRWIVAERSFRPPGFHRNCVGEFVAFLHGFYGDLLPGSTTMTNNFTPHGPETVTVEAGRNEELVPVKAEDMLLVLFESRFPIQVTDFGEKAPEFLHDYTARWDGFKPYFKK